MTRLAHLLAAPLVAAALLAAAPGLARDDTGTPPAWAQDSREKPIAFERLKGEMEDKSSLLWESRRKEMEFLADAGDYPPAQLYLSDDELQGEKGDPSLAYYWLRRAKVHGADVAARLEALEGKLAKQERSRVEWWLKFYRHPVWEDEARPELPQDVPGDPRHFTLGHYLREIEALKSDELPAPDFELALAYFTAKESDGARPKSKAAAEIELRRIAAIWPTRTLRAHRTRLVGKDWPPELISFYDSAIAWRESLLQLGLDEVHDVARHFERESRFPGWKDYVLAGAYKGLADILLDYLWKLDYAPAIFEGYIEDFYDRGPRRRAQAHLALWRLADEHEHVGAQIALAARYQDGQDSIRNPAKALYWLLVGKANGADVESRLNSLLANIADTDRAKAESWIAQDLLPRP